MELKTANKTDSNREVLCVSEALRNLGVSAHILGYHYLRYAILLMLTNSKMQVGITKVVYPLVAEKFETTAQRVERAIRHAILIAWGRCDVQTQHAFFGSAPKSNKGRPTNSEFISCVADKLRLDLGLPI